MDTQDMYRPISAAANALSRQMTLRDVRAAVFAVSLLWTALPLFHAGCYCYHYLRYFAGYGGTPDSVSNAVFVLTYTGDTFPRVYYLLGTATLLMAAVLLLLRFQTAAEPGGAAGIHPWNVLFLAMLCQAALSTALSEEPLDCFLGSVYRQDGLRSYGIYACVYLCALFLDRRSRLWVLRSFAAVSTVCVLLFCAQTFRLPVLRWVFADNRCSVFYNTNHYGYYLTMSILLLSGLYLYDRGRRRHWFYLLSLCLQIYALIVNDTLGCYLAVLPGLAAVCLFRYRSGRDFTPRVFLPAALFLGISVLLAWNPLSWRHAGNLMWNFSALHGDISNLTVGGETVDYGGSGRVYLWRRTLELIPKRPLLGYGPDSSALLRNATLFVNERPHNEYLQHIFFLGFPALLFYLAALFTLARDRWRNITRLDVSALAAAGAVVGYLASAFFGNTMFYTSPHFFLLLGMTAANPAGESNETNPDGERGGAEHNPL